MAGATLGGIALMVVPVLLALALPLVGVSAADLRSVYASIVVSVLALPARK